MSIFWHLKPHSISLNSLLRLRFRWYQTLSQVIKTSRDKHSKKFLLRYKKKGKKRQAQCLKTTPKSLLWKMWIWKNIDVTFWVIFFSGIWMQCYLELLGSSTIDEKIDRGIDNHQKPGYCVPAIKCQCWQVFTTLGYTSEDKPCIGDLVASQSNSGKIEQKK